MSLPRRLLRSCMPCVAFHRGTLLLRLSSVPSSPLIRSLLSLRATCCVLQARGHGGPACAAVEGLQGAALLAHAFSARRPRLEQVALALPTWAWRALSRQVVAQHGVSQLDEQSHARRRCVCARWRREHGSCCLSFDMAAMGDLVARQLVASGRQWL